MSELSRKYSPSEIFSADPLGHSENEGGPANVALEQDRMTQFAVGVVLHRPTGQPLFANLKQAIAASPPIWEYSTQPTFPSSQ